MGAAGLGSFTPPWAGTVLAPGLLPELASPAVWEATFCPAALPDDGAGSFEVSLVQVHRVDSNPLPGFLEGSAWGRASPGSPPAAEPACPSGALLASPIRSMSSSRLCSCLFSCFCPRLSASFPGPFSCDPRKAALRGGIGGGGGSASAIGGAERGDAMADAIRAGAGQRLTRGRKGAGRRSARWR